MILTVRRTGKQTDAHLCQIAFPARSHNIIPNLFDLVLLFFISPLLVLEHYIVKVHKQHKSALESRLRKKSTGSQG
jgi:hypothetical protein